MNKKKLISGLMSMALAFSTLGGLTANAYDDIYAFPQTLSKVEVSNQYVYIYYDKGTSRSFHRGDINKDGDVNVTDLKLLTAWIKRYRILSDDSRFIADINADGEWDVSDISALAAYVKGIRGFRAPENCILYNWSDQTSWDDLVVN